MRPIAVALVLLALGGGGFAFISDASPPAAVGGGPDISALAWMAGTWTGTDGRMEMEEVWMAPKGGHMLGLHRDVAGERMVSFEFLQIASRPDAIAYIARPGGREPTVFPLKESSEKKVVFENPKHDYPQRILYWLDPEGALHARIEGDRDGKKGPMEWTWTRSSGAAGK